ncbi:hypothetical protein ABH912_000105 [Pseudomonas sp. BT76 TE3572]|uniref:Knr4/Smi1-like domain-containing protein n=1 Tax=Pseudomonas mandelii PD30 TaxID=1419583 RepID=A0A059L084_9PSED|nr:SMI1/KNR4 family protein [Pseudomonas mandelii]KDD67535.1 hypothetical protein V466_18375 [Pseudomonas mandelii PD30]
MNFFIKIENRQNFTYPKEFINTISTTPPIDIEPWWFIVFEEGDVNSWYDTLKKLYPKRELIPFAKFNANDDIACFDGDDNSGNPKVLIIHAYASEGWEHHGSYNNFSEWLTKAIKTHQEWEEEE